MLILKFYDPSFSVELLKPQITFSQGQLNLAEVGSTVKFECQWPGANVSSQELQSVVCKLYFREEGTDTKVHLSNATVAVVNQSFHIELTGTTESNTGDYFCELTRQKSSGMSDELFLGVYSKYL